MLRVLAQAQHLPPARQRGLCSLLGYAGTKPAAAPAGGRQRLPMLPPAPPVNQGKLGSADLRAPLFAALVTPSEGTTDGPRMPQPADAAPPPPLTDADWGPDPQATRLAPLPALAPRGRVLPALQRALQVATPGGLDLPRLVHDLAQRRLPSELPRAAVPQLAAHWMLVLDFSDALDFYHADVHTLVRWVQRALGGGIGKVRVLADPLRPIIGWVDWKAATGCDASSGAMPASGWAVPDAGTRIVLVSDLGLAGAGRGGVSAAWSRWLQHMQAHGAQVQVWSPVPLRAKPQQPALARLQVLHWTAASPLRSRQLAQGMAHAGPARVQVAQSILARLAFAPFIYPALVRRVRLLLGAQAKDAGLEHLVWSSPDLTPGRTSRRMRPEALPRHRQAFAKLAEDAGRATQDLVTACYRQFSQPLAHMHTLAWATRAPGLTADDQAAIGAALRFAGSLAVQPQAAASVPWIEVVSFLGQWLRQTDVVEMQCHAPAFARLYVALQRLAMHNGPFTLPPGLPHEAMAQALAPDRPAQSLWLLQDAYAGQALLSRHPPRAGRLPLHPNPLLLATADLQGLPEGPPLWLDLAGDDTLLARLAAGTRLQLRAAGLHVCIGELARPRGVAGWWQSRDGLHLVGQPLGDLALLAGPDVIELLPPVEGAADQRLRLQVPRQPSADGRVAFGIDADHGLWLDLSMVGVVQRFRWIAPGSLWMGSPDAEHKREKREGPRHAVTITRGFWMADSACTQALWQAVMGKNPSDFKGDTQRPVENVSWDDVQGFLKRLQAMVPDCEAVLPTEAMWEYACRAGTETPFSFGDDITPEQVNYDGNYPYRGGKKGLYRKATVAVKSLPANAWGLHEMHGNVWEWCADGPRTYDGQAQVDPEGPSGSAEDRLRVLRGGSWAYYARGARSARRDAILPGDRDQFIGFRLCLRSIEPGPGTGGIAGRDGPPGPGGPLSSAPGGRLKLDSVTSPKPTKTRRVKRQA